MFLVLPIFGSKFQGFAPGGPNGQGPPAQIRTLLSHSKSASSFQDLAPRNAMKKSEIVTYLGAGGLRSREK